MKGGWLIEKPIHLSVREEKWAIVIRQSQFHVFIDGPEPSDIATFMNEVNSVVQGCLDALGFHLAIPLKSELLSLVLHDKGMVVYRDDQWGEILETSSPSKFVEAEKLGPFIQASTDDSLIRLALADVRAAIEQPDDTLMLCYRAIEGVRQWFLQGDADNGSARSKSWGDMRASLDLEESDIRKLEKKALARRHGAIPPVSEAERREAILLARKAISRLVAYRLQPKANAGVS